MLMMKGGLYINLTGVTSTWTFHYKTLASVIHIGTICFFLHNLPIIHGIIYQIVYGYIDFNISFTI